ncbi:hypothetical protein [Wolbachia endosymbiont of Ctenocephalides felis wCfeT]|nr:hypothetical protein [Wolbachia endosymbiont of Ctenocephalides felis wCfeT]
MDTRKLPEEEQQEASKPKIPKDTLHQVYIEQSTGQLIADALNLCISST